VGTIHQDAREPAAVAPFERGTMLRTLGRALLKSTPFVLALTLVAGLALASIPDSNGIIHGCYKTSGGALRVINTDRGQTCGTGERALKWNQRAATEGHIAMPIPFPDPCEDQSSYMPVDCGSPALVSVFLERSRYPTVTKFYLDVGHAVATSNAGCLRLFDYTANAAVTGSEKCTTNSSSTDALNEHVLIGPFALTGVGEHEYAIQKKGAEWIFTASIVAKW
jgi:hypothetical protein